MLRSPLEAAQQAHDELRFEDCLIQLRRWAHLRPPPADQRPMAALYEGLCRFNLGQTDEAEEHFERALRMQPGLALPQGTSPKIRAAFRKASARASLEPPLPEPPPPPSVVERIVLTVPRASPPAPYVPRRPSIGLPIGLGAGALVAVGGFVGLGLAARNQANLANHSLYTSEAAHHALEARREAIWANVSLGVAIASAAGSLLSYFLLNPPAPKAPPAEPVAPASVAPGRNL